MAKAKRLFREHSSHQFPLREGEDDTCLVPQRLGGPRACSSDVPHFLVCREEQWRSLGAIPRDLEPPCPELLLMPSCEDEDVTCEVPHDGRNRRPPSLLAEALSSACLVPTPHVFRRGDVQHLSLCAGRSKGGPESDSRDLVSQDPELHTYAILRG